MALQLTGSINITTGGLTTDLPGRYSGSLSGSFVGDGSGLTGISGGSSVDDFPYTGSATISGSTWATQYWGQRTVGDEISAPSPSFVGERISGISFFKNRLVLMSNENVVCSQAGNFLDFYPSTVITIVDSDPVDLSAGSKKRIEFRYAIQQPVGLLAFADNAQYMLQTRTEAFSPATAELNALSTFSHSNNIKPVDLGNTLVITEQNSKSISVTELTINIDTPPLKTDLSKLVPSYIPSGITSITNTLSASVFGLRSIQAPNAV